jgi:hypothetical protein
MRIPSTTSVASTTSLASTTIRRRLIAAVFVVGALVALAAGPATAQGNGDGVREKPSDRRIGVGDVFLAKNEKIENPVVAIDGNATVDGSTTKNVFVVSGDAIVSGHVGGSVVVLDGNARISGKVDEDVIALSGRAIIADGAVVRGDVQSSKEPRVSSGAEVKGDVKDIDVTGVFTALGFSLLGFFWLAVTVSTAILGALLLALFGRAFDTAATAARMAPGKSIAWGLLVSIGLPLLAIAASFSIVGLPLGLGTAGALGVIGALGYLTSALCLGRLMIKAPRNIFGAFFAGWGILRVLALLPGIGVLVWTGASIWGVGALTVAAWRASRGPAESTTPPGEPAPAESATSTPERAKVVATKTAATTTKTTTAKATPKAATPKPEKA